MTFFESLRRRGLVEAATDPEIEKALESPVTVYCGFDPSNSSLQAGNLVSVMTLRRFQLAGHKVTGPTWPRYSISTAPTPRRWWTTWTGTAT